MSKGRKSQGLLCCAQALVKCTGVPEACAELEEDLAGLLEALSRIFDPTTCFHQHNKNQDAGGIRVRPLRPCPAPSPMLIVMNRHMHCQFIAVNMRVSTCCKCMHMKHGLHSGRGDESRAK